MVDKGRPGNDVQVIRMKVESRVRWAVSGVFILLAIVAAVVSLRVPWEGPSTLGGAAVLLVGGLYAARLAVAGVVIDEESLLLRPDGIRRSRRVPLKAIERVYVDTYMGFRSIPCLRLKDGETIRIKWLFGTRWRDTENEWIVGAVRSIRMAVEASARLEDHQDRYIADERGRGG